MLTYSKVISPFVYIYTTLFLNLVIFRNMVNYNSHPFLLTNPMLKALIGWIHHTRDDQLDECHCGMPPYLTQSVHFHPMEQQANSLPIAVQETQGVQQGPQQQAKSLPIPGQATHGAENNNLGMLQ
jgi:hypothetical protein